MLGILGLFGAVFAGFMADGVIATKTKLDGDDTAEAEDNVTESDEETGDTVDLLDVASQNQAPDVDASGTESSDSPFPTPLDVELTGSGDDDILTGEAGADTIDGGDGDDLLDGRDGDDVINGDNGEDYIGGGAGDDDLRGGAGNDVVDGHDGNDLLTGGAGDDSLSGHMDDDYLNGDEGDDTLVGGSGADTLAGGAGNDWLAGGFDDDELFGDEGEDTLDGNAGDDTLWGVDAENPEDSQGSDFLNGGTGDDTLMIGAGDWAHGGEGEDSFALNSWIGSDDLAHIMDYEPSEDEIVVLYDANAHPDPHVELLTDEDSDDATIVLDGVPLAVIANGANLTVDALKLTPSNIF
ncbi:calcium-binding protein [Pseudorhodobacter turbinis]|uniref:Calcium-binding protein n=1 Tax=Pseudorhodobacter turbinis TaxID=2500533 RepID=A0A4P8EFH4_9RHOB|nr:calcium-binding protein [Pseudorhodobacter turbinis]QCO55616.1 calcium-binding protein [Pseudorhodobacter turbinis]